jgi:hypothetical protein
MRDSAAVFRLGLAPVLLLGWNMAADDPLPFLAPVLLVTILTGSPARPRLAKLAGALAFVVGLTWVITQMFAALADTPATVWIVLVALAAAAFARLARRPGDMLAMLTLMVASIVVVIREWAGDLGLAVPWMLGAAMAQAIVTALIAYTVLPSHEAPAPAAMKHAPAAGRADVVEAFGKSVGLVVLLGASLHLQDNSAILVALTAVNVLAASVAETRGRVLLIANAAAAAMALPLLAVAMARPAPVVLLLMALAAGLWIARGIGEQGPRRVIAQAGLPVFVVLLGGLLPKAGDVALSLLADRLLTLGGVMAYALGLLAVLGTVGRRQVRVA